MSFRVAVLVLACGLALPAGAETGAAPEQVITAVTPEREQRIEAVTPSGEQRVEAVDPDEAQRVAEGTKDPGNRGLRTAGRIAVGVMAAVLSVAAMAASLLFL